MAARRPFKDVHTLCLGVYRDKPGNYKHCANVLGISWRTAKKAWEEGWPAPGCRAIKLIFEDEKIEAQRLIIEEENRQTASQRAEAAEQLRLAAERATVRDDYLLGRKREGQMVRLAQQNAFGLVAVCNQLAQSAIPIAQLCRKVVEGEAALKKYNGVQLLKILERVALIINTTSIVSRQVMEQERLHMGEPTAIFGTASPVDHNSAVAVLGSEEEVSAALDDLINGRNTERVVRLLEARFQQPAIDVSTPIP